jgi:hypothetical protein
MRYMKKNLLLALAVLMVSVSLSQNSNQGITSPIHQKFLGKIIMSKTKDAIAFKNEKEALFQNEFNYSDEIYLRVFMDNSLRDYLKTDLPELKNEDILKNGFFNVHFFFDDKQICTYYIKGELENDHKEIWTTFKGALYNANNGDALMKNGYSVMLTEADKSLITGKHKVRIEVRAAINEPVKHESKIAATGEFTLNILPNSITPYDEHLCLPKAKMSNPALEAKVMKKYGSISENSSNVKEARINSEDWTIVRHDRTGLILYRTLSLTVISLHKNGYYVYKNCVISQDYIGGKFQDTFKYSDDAYETRINSLCVTKK